MKIEVGLVGGMWNDEDKALVAAVLRTRAFDYLVTNSVSNENPLMAVGSDENLQNKLSDLVDRPNVSNFSWNYAIFWQISQTKSGDWGLGTGDWVLGWGDGCCREPKEGKVGGSGLIALRLEDYMQPRMRKRVKILSPLPVVNEKKDENILVSGLAIADKAEGSKIFGHDLNSAN